MKHLKLQSVRSLHYMQQFLLLPIHIHIPLFRYSTSVYEKISIQSFIGNTIISIQSFIGNTATLHIFVEEEVKLTILQFATPATINVSLSLYSNISKKCSFQELMNKKIFVKRQDMLVFSDRYQLNFKIFSKNIHLPSLFVNIV